MAETTSDLQTDEETSHGKRKRRPTFRYLESDTDSDSTPSKRHRDSVIPQPPQAPLPPPTLLPPPAPLPRRNLFPDSPSTSRNQTFPTPHSKRVFCYSAVDEKMLQLLEEIRDQNRTSQRLLTLILRKISSSSSENMDVLPDGIKFPLETPQELTALEEKLEDQTVKDKVCGHLSSIGGTNIPDAVRRIMKYVLGHALSTMYNWVGKGGKKAAFSSLFIKDVMIRAVRKNMPAATNAELEPVMKDWLRYAKDRQGGRNERRIK
ncbi:uncharacterized protein LOC124255137 [Haliotis rubra]|uniref:uncharacterized protein LOC124255137 n=1 Tax=Haliotis rubra TaxID=36100 RepID=UPI001EE56FA2|nr:uncharacterized protein LOC124255137 [Haliotis rubra]